MCTLFCQKFRKVHCAVVQIVEITEIYSHREKFRQINDLVISLVKTLLSRYHLFREINYTVKTFTKEVVFTEIFQKKNVIQKLCKLHCGKTRNSLSM